MNHLNQQISLFDQRISEPVSKLPIFSDISMTYQLIIVKILFAHAFGAFIRVIRYWAFYKWSQNKLLVRIRSEPGMSKINKKLLLKWSSKLLVRFRSKEWTTREKISLYKSKSNQPEGLVRFEIMNHWNGRSRFLAPKPSQKDFFQIWQLTILSSPLEFCPAGFLQC